MNKLKSACMTLLAITLTGGVSTGCARAKAQSCETLEDDISIAMEVSPDSIAMFPFRDVKKLAEQDHIRAIRALIDHYYEKAEYYAEVEEVIEVVPEEEGGGYRDVTDEYKAEKEESDKSNQYYRDQLTYWLDKGLRMGDDEAYFVKGSLAATLGNDEDKYLYWEKAANAGNTQAMLMLGTEYYNTYHIPGNGDKALYWLTKAYEAGVPSAGWHLFHCYLAEIATARDEEKAVNYLIQSADKGFFEAQVDAARVFFEAGYIAEAKEFIRLALMQYDETSVISLWPEYRQIKARLK